MKRSRKIQLGKGLPITVPAPTDYGAKLEVARNRLRLAGRAQAIDAPPTPPATKAAVQFKGTVYPFPTS